MGNSTLCITEAFLSTSYGNSRPTSIAFTSSSSVSDSDSDQLLLVSGHEDGHVRVWNACTGACLRAHKKKGGEVTAITMLVR